MTNEKSSPGRRAQGAHVLHKRHHIRGVPLTVRPDGDSDLHARHNLPQAQSEDIGVLGRHRHPIRANCIVDGNRVGQNGIKIVEGTLHQPFIVAHFEWLWGDRLFKRDSERDTAGALTSENWLVVSGMTLDWARKYGYRCWAPSTEL